MRLPFRSSLSRLSHRLRELARNRPEEAEEYLDSHQDEWEEIAETDPGSAADILEALHEEDAADLLRDLDTDEAADVLDEMRAPAAADVIEEMTTDNAAKLISEMETHQAVDLLAQLEDEVRDEVMVSLDPDVRLSINRLIVYPDDSAGGLMTTDYAALPAGITSGEAIEALRRLHQEIGSNLTYVYVVDAQGRIAGVVPFRELVFARPGDGLDEIMHSDPVTVTVDTDREIVAELIQRYHLISLPVTDAQQHLVGIVKVDEAMEAAQVEATEDIAQMVGAGAEETVYTEIGVSVRRRLPWIALNLLIGLGLAVVIREFESIIRLEVVLASFMPMVALLGGNSGAQSLAVIIRAMAVGSLPPGRAVRAIRREAIIGLINGLVIATLSGVFGGIVAGDARIGVVITVAVFANLVVAGAVGASIPIVLRRLGQDPALASNIFLTTVTDVVGFGGFLLTAKLILNL
ncbi:MAG: magnesium transporter [bacterium]|nr:magnesium transporter [bacterium]MCP4964228.1 magnesium transporter [bacterium]